MRKTLILWLTLVASCAHPTVAAGSHDWCKSGATGPYDGPWQSLGREAVIPVVERYLHQSVERLKADNFVRLTEKEARKLTAGEMVSRKGDIFLLARAGIVGAPGVSIHQYLRNAKGAVTFAANLTQDGKNLLVETFETSPPYPARQLPVVIRAKPGIEAASSRCMAAR